MLSNQFRERVAEIDKYYAFLDSVTAQRVSVTVERRNKQVVQSVDKDLVKILKANAFLLLYNLVEASVREGIEYIYDSLENDGLTYKDLRDELRHIWINESVVPDSRRLPENLVTLVQELVQSAIDDHAVTFKVESIPIAGNLDARKVRELAVRYGFDHSTHYRAKGGAVLLKVKQERNNLAHGVTSFVECGRDVTYPSLKQTKAQLVRYIENILDNIELYVEQKRYKR